MKKGAVSTEDAVNSHGIIGSLTASSVVLIVLMASPSRAGSRIRKDAAVHHVGI